MIRYMVITKKEEERPYKVTYIYYGSILTGARHKVMVGPRHQHYEEVKKIYERLKQLIYGKKFRRKS